MVTFNIMSCADIYDGIADIESDNTLFGSAAKKTQKPSNYENDGKRFSPCGPVISTSGQSNMPQKKKKKLNHS